MKRLLVCVMAFFVLTPGMLIAGEPQNLGDLARMSPDQLETLFENAPRPDYVPSGKTRGLVFFQPGKIHSRLLGRSLHMLWQGKQLNGSEGVMKNRMAGFSIIPASMSIDDSFGDGEAAVVLNYQGMQDKVTQFADVARDEIREVSPGLWLGRMWVRGKDGLYTPSTWFGLKVIGN